MALVPPLTKTPYEAYNCSVDFGTHMVAGDALSIVSVTATLAGQDRTSAVISTTPAPWIVGTSVFWQTVGGVLGAKYVVSVKVVGNPSGQQQEADVNLVIASKQSVGTLPKTPFASPECSVDFSPNISAGDHLSIQSVTATLAGLDRTASVIRPTPPPQMSGYSALWETYGGLPDAHYVISVKVYGIPSGEQIEASVDLLIESE